MKHATLHALGLVAVAALALGAGPASGATVANGPYYATPSWDQTLPSSTRFIVLSNFNSAAVLDRETGLVWERDPFARLPTSGIWDGATALCPQLRIGGRMGWRLPSVHELASLVDPSIPSGTPALPVGHPFLHVAGVYWSASAVANHPGLIAYTVTFEQGGFVSQDFETQTYGIWCVRGGGPLSQQ